MSDDFLPVGKSSLLIGQMLGPGEFFAIEEMQK